MQLRLVNLRRSSDRLALFNARNPHMSGVVRVDAVDGKTVDRASMVATGVLQADLNYSDGALGCALSHLRLWRDAVQSQQVFTVLEDDAILCGNFEEEAKRTIATLPDDWDFVMWGYNFDAPLTFHLGAQLSQGTCMFGQDAMRAHAATFHTAVVETRLLKLMRGFGSMAYSISPRGAERLINFCLPLRPLNTVHPGLAGAIPNRRIDNMLAHAWPAMSAHVALPPLAISENDVAASTVQAGRSRRQIYKQDLLPPRELDAVASRLGLHDGVAIGLRATHDMELPTAGLRATGWRGFDIAVDPKNVVKSLFDRGVSSEFELLYVGPGCDVGDLLSRILEVFHPRVIIMPPDQSILAHELAPDTSVDESWPSYAALLESNDYVLQKLPGASSYHLSVRRDLVDPVVQRRDLRLVSSMSANAVNQPEAVRLWQ